MYKQQKISLKAKHNIFTPEKQRKSKVFLKLRIVVILNYCSYITKINRILNIYPNMLNITCY